MKNFITRQNISLRLQQLLILVLHLILLKWIHYALTESGSMLTSEVLMHFAGMATYGALLIRVCAAWGKWLHKKELPKAN